MRKKISQFAYYKANEFNPTRLSVEKLGYFADLWAKRMNLYNNRLKIPQGFWKGAHVLEIGPSSGENALVLARLGAKFSFVEPMESSVVRLTRLFKANHLDAQILNIDTREVQTVRFPRGRFDCVIAEGFLYTLSDRAMVLERLLASLKPGGLLSLSTLDPVGCFSEYVKKILFLVLCASHHAETLDEQLRLGKELFNADYESIPHSRSIELWIRDNFLNPTFEYASMWSIEKILSDAGPGVRVYSSWPRLEHACEMTWYKKVDSAAHERSRLLDSYVLRGPAFFHGSTLDEGLYFSHLRDARHFRKCVCGVMRQLSVMARTQRTCIPAAALEAFARAIRSAGALKDKHYVLPVLMDAKRLLSAPSVAQYKKAVHLRKCWGVSYPYYVLQKIDVDRH